MKFAALPNEIVQNLLDQNFSLQELFHLRQVCARFCALIKYCIGKRKSLKIFWSFSDINVYPTNIATLGLESQQLLRLQEIGNFSDDDLVLNASHFNELTCDWLVHLFPHVVHLLIFFTYEAANYPDYSVLSTLLERYSSTLTGLSLIGGPFRDLKPQKFADPTSVETRLALCQSINQLTSLNQLNLCISGLFQKNLVLPTILSPTLSRLERLCFKNSFSDGILTHLGPNCTELSLRTYIKGIEDLEDLGPELRRGRDNIKGGKPITHFALENMDHLPAFLQTARITTHLRSLHLTSHSNFNSRNVRLQMSANLFPRLRLLSSLRELKLTKFDAAFANVDHPEACYPALSQIEHLTFDIIYGYLDDPEAHAEVMLKPCKLFQVLGGVKIPIDAHHHLRYFPLLCRFRFMLRISSYTDVLPAMLSRHHRERFRAEYNCARLWKDDVTVRGFVGTQCWTRQSGNGGIWIKHDGHFISPLMLFLSRKRPTDGDSSVSNLQSILRRRRASVGHKKMLHN